MNSAFVYVNPTENLNIYLCDLNVSMSLLRSVRNCEIFYGYFLGLTLDVVGLEVGLVLKSHLQGQVS